MLQIEGILHPTDFSEISDNAFAYARHLARDYNVPLYVLHVSSSLEAVKGENISDERPEQYLATEWERLEQVSANDVEIRHALEEGDPAEQIVHFVQTHPCNLIVMGTHGRTGLDRLLNGSVAEEVVRRAPCPVVTLKSRLTETTIVGEAASRRVGSNDDLGAE